MVMDSIRLWVKVATWWLGSNQVEAANFCHQVWGAFDMNKMDKAAMRTSGRSATLLAKLVKIGWIYESKKNSHFIIIESADFSKTIYQSN